MRKLETKAAVSPLLLLVILSCFARPCLAQTKDYWLKGIRESIGQAFANMHFVVIDTKEGKIEYRVDMHVKIHNDEIIQNGIYLVDSNLSPISFDLRFKSMTKNVNIKGQCSNNVMNLSIIDENGKVKNQKMPFQDTYFDVILSDLILKKSKEKHFTVNIFDPTGLITQGTPARIQELQVEVSKDGEDKVNATVTNGIITKKHHINLQGQIEQIKFVEQNIRFYATDPNDAGDINHLRAYDVWHKTQKAFPNAIGNGITKARMRLTWKNLPFEGFCFEDNRQKPVKQLSDDNNYEIVFEFTKANAPSTITKVPVNNKELKIFLKDGSYIKSDDPAIRQQVVDIIGDEKDQYVIAERIMKWTHRNIKFTSIASYLSGPEVLEKRIGHCAHHTILFASLARAAGIPTRIAIGLVNIKTDRHLWGSHFWNEVWVGEWVAVDPTRGEFITGPSHIKFAEAPTIIELQGAISRLENNLKLEILDFTVKN
jgi:hypothetical protein